MNALTETISALSRSIGVHVSSEVPPERPNAFVTVQRGAGQVTRFDDDALLTVQVWHMDREQLESLADRVEDALLEMPDHVTEVYSVSVQSRSYYPLQVGGTHPRYVITAEVYCRR